MLLDISSVLQNETNLTCTENPGQVLFSTLPVENMLTNMLES